MSARGDNNFMRYVYMGQEGEVIPRGATHIIVHKSVTIIRAWKFSQHPNMVEVICHEKVEQIKERAFWHCPRLRRVVMPGVTIVERGALNTCGALTDVECGKLEIIRKGAFCYCLSLRSINLSSARIVEPLAFGRCEALTNAKFGNKLERIEEEAFLFCTSLAQITIPLKDGIIAGDDTFMGCENFKNANLVEEEILHETIAALQLEEWRNDIYKEIDSINQTLPTADAGRFDDEVEDMGEKAVAIRDWIRSVLSKIIEYKAQHHRLLEEDVAPTLQRILPQDIVMNSVLPFLELPSHSFWLEDHEEGEEEDSDGDEE